MSGTSRIKIRFGDVEIEYEGTDDFLTAELPNLLKAVSELHRASPQGASNGEAASKNSTESNINNDTNDLSVTTIAQKLSASKLPDLILAAALSLNRRGKASFEKKDIRKEMRDAVGFWKASMATNFDKALARLAKSGRITHSGGENYALSPGQRDALVVKLSE